MGFNEVIPSALKSGSLWSVPAGDCKPSWCGEMHQYWNYINIGAPQHHPTPGTAISVTQKQSPSMARAAQEYLHHSFISLEMSMKKKKKVNYLKHVITFPKQVEKPQPTTGDNALTEIFLPEEFHPQLELGQSSPTSAQGSGHGLNPGGFPACNSHLQPHQQRILTSGQKAAETSRDTKGWLRFLPGGSTFCGWD